MIVGKKNCISSGYLWIIFVICISISIASGVVSGWYFGYSGKKEIVVLDVEKIIEAKKDDFIKKFKDRNPDPGLKEEMEKEISSFMEKLNRIVEEESKGRIVLVKDSVVSSAVDITDEVSRRIVSKN